MVFHISNTHTRGSPRTDSTPANRAVESVSASPRHSACPGAIRHLVILAALLATLNAGAQDNKDETPLQAQASKALSRTPYINELLIERHIPLLGGYWGFELYVDGPLNGEPAGANWVVRKARFGYSRDFQHSWSLRLTANYNEGGGLEMDDSYLTYSGWDRTLINLGIKDPAFGLESANQSAGSTFMENALAAEAISENRSAGIHALHRDPKRILNASLVLFGVSEDNVRESGQGVAARYVRAPIVATNGKFTHLGASVSYRWNAQTDGTQFRTRPEIHTINDFYVDTGEISGASEIARVSLAAAQVNGRFSWQTELLGARVRRDDGPSVDFHGAYFFVSWFLTNDQRNYDFGQGLFRSVNVSNPLLQGGKGAFELAGRISRVDLTDQSVIGGVETNVSVGFNWYLNNQFRVMTNLIKVIDVDRPGSEFNGEDPLSLSLRVQWIPH